MQETSSLTCRQRIIQHVEDANELRPFPKSATRLLEVCKQENVNINEIIQLIECDPSIAAKVLSLSNSPLYGTPRPVQTIGHAVVILGFQTVSKVAVAIATGQVFSSGDAVTAAFRQKVFQQSVGTAVASRTFARTFGDAHPDEAFLVGIMQEIGQLIFLDVLSDQYLLLDENHDPANPTEVEQAAYGIDHADVGQRFGVGCGLPAPINQAIANHHAVPLQVEDPLSQSVILGGGLARNWNLGFESCNPDHLDSFLLGLDQAGVSLAQVSELESECRDGFAAANEIFGI